MCLGIEIKFLRCHLHIANVHTTTLPTHQSHRSDCASIKREGMLLYAPQFQVVQCLCPCRSGGLSWEFGSIIQLAIELLGGACIDMTASP